MCATTQKQQKPNINEPFVASSGDIISQDLKWDDHIESIVKKAQQRLYYLHQLRKINLQKGAAETVLLHHHRICPLHVNNCLV